MDDLPLDENGWWSADIDVSRTPSPGIPTKRMKMTLEDISQDFRGNVDLSKDNEWNNILRAQRTPDVMGYGNVETYKDLWALPNDSADLTVDQWEGFMPAPVRERQLKSKMKTGCIPCLYVIRIDMDVLGQCLTYSL